MRSAFAALQRERSASAEPIALCAKGNSPAGCPAGPIPFDWSTSLSGRRAPSRHPHSEQAQAEEGKAARFRHVRGVSFVGVQVHVREATRAITVDSEREPEESATGNALHELEEEILIRRVACTPLETQY